ncbi:MAG: 50S ribosomal protein L30 [Oscillospiraceae bacterium]|jgi:large subunit ribosomal protein L30|nr:50S ribosomal protein L30 [Oscillospiraceae bacterium]
MKLKITLVRSPIASLEKQIRTVKALGLYKIRQSVVLPDNACTRGMIFRVKHMVKVEEISE